MRKRATLEGRNLAEFFLETSADAGNEAPEAADRPLYAISVAAELVGLGVGTLRQYEARGLLCPKRTRGGTRQYSVNDLVRLRRIACLLTEGLNLAGVALVLQLQGEVDSLRRRLGEAPGPETGDASSEQAADTVPPDGQPERETNRISNQRNNKPKETKWQT